MSLESKFNASTDLIGVLSVGGVLISGLLLLTPMQGVGYIGIGSGLGAFTASVVSKKKHLQIANEQINKITTHHSGEISAKEDEIIAQTKTANSLRATVNSLRSNVKSFESDKQAHALELSSLQGRAEVLMNQNQGLRQHIECVTGELDRLIDLARSAVEEALGEWEIKLTLLTTTKREQYPKLAERLDELLGEAEDLLAEYAVKLAETPKKRDSLADLLSLYYCVNDDLSHVKTKAIQAIAKLTNQETQLELHEVSEILEEWQDLDLVPRDKVRGLVDKYEAMLQEFRLDLNNRFQSTMDIAQSMEGQVNQDEEFFLRLRMQIKRLEGEVQELQGKVSLLSKPITYPAATRTDMRIANIIIAYFQQIGIILDRAGSDFKGHEATLEFISDRTGRLVLASELNEHTERLQGLTHVLNNPDFKLDAETGLMTLLVRWANKLATNNTDQAKRLLSPLVDVIKKLVEGLSHKPTTRIMGATGEGKGVMARYLLSSILSANPWYCRLHDPQDGSSEDHWDIPKVSRSGSDLKEALKDIENQLTRREATKNWEVTTLDILDEIDTHLDKKEKKEAFIDLISRIRHCGMKLILIGQNPKVGRAGFEWSDMQQMNCIYMGTSALDAIEANPQLKPRKDKLTKDYITLSEHYESANEGLDDREKYLFGLVVIPGKTPLWVELPRPDSIKIDCQPFLLAKSFNIPDSMREIVKSKNFKTCDNISDDKDADNTADKPIYVDIGGSADNADKEAKATILAICKKHPEVELKRQTDGRYYCKSCKKRVPKTDLDIKEKIV